MNWSKINAALIWAAVTATVSAVLWMFATFATAAEVDDIKLQMAYSSWYDRFDDYEEAKEEGRDELAKEYKRQMERLKAIICEEDPEWERCDDTD